MNSEIKDVRDGDLRVIVFGRGDKVLAKGDYLGEPCLLVSDAKMPASVGDDAEREGICDENLGINPIVIVTGNEKRAKLLYMVLCGELDGLVLSEEIGDK
ncbi:MAG: hypothetical protein RR390_00370 [Hafnia sp.]